MKSNNTTVKAEFSKFDNSSNWVSGLCGNYYFEAKLFDDPSEFGINDGRVSKLTIKTKNKTVLINYDRGWDIKPVKSEKPVYEAIMELLENSPKRFDHTPTQTTGKEDAAMEWWNGLSNSAKQGYDNIYLDKDELWTPEKIEHIYNAEHPTAPKNLDWDLYPNNETGIYDDESGYLQGIKNDVERRAAPNTEEVNPDKFAHLTVGKLLEWLNRRPTAMKLPIKISFGDKTLAICSLNEGNGEMWLNAEIE